MTIMERELGTIDYTASKTETFDLPREHFYKRLHLRLTGLSTVDTTAATAKHEDNPLSIVRRIEVVANGKDTIKSYSMTDLYYMNKFDYGVAGELTQDTTAVGATAVIASAWLDFALPNHKLGEATMLPSHVLSSLQLKVTWGAYKTHMLTGALGAASAFTLGKITVVSEELLNEGQPIVNDLSVNKESSIEKGYTTETGWQTGIELPLGNVYRRIIVATREGTAVAGDYPKSNALFTDFELKQDGVIIHRKKSFLQGQAQDLFDYSLASSPTGFMIIDFDVDEEFTQLVDTSDFSSFKLHPYFAAAPANSLGKISLIPQELIVPK